MHMGPVFSGRWSVPVAPVSEDSPAATKRSSPTPSLKERRRGASNAHFIDDSFRCFAPEAVVVSTLVGKA
jgi:hypothetical protein